MDTPDKISAYINKYPQWKKELNTLLGIIRKSKMEEAIKWGMPNFSSNGKFILGLGAFKKHFCIWYFNGAFLKDEAKVLVNAQTGKTVGMRQWRFTSFEDIKAPLIHQYNLEAIANQKAGKTITILPKREVLMPEELQKKLSKDKKLNAAFDKLTSGRQKDFKEYIGEAKREATRISRLEKSVELILAGVGLNDKYKG